MFIVLLRYIKPLEEVDRFLDEHSAFLDKFYGLKKFVFSGRRNPRIGGVILMNVHTDSEVWEIIREDPFHKHHIAEYEVIEFFPTKWDSRFSCFFE
jgi:uncharacterized protein YciI